MKIIRLELKGHRGFKLRQINYLVFEPTKKTQIILGTNGSGKTSLLMELSPLPGSPVDYAKGGFKVIEIEHLGRNYRLSSLFEQSGAKYLFETDGENLNPGGTVTVFKELVKKHFGYTADIHALLVRQTKFSSMSVADRRAWFTLISDIDYDYALKYHRKVKDRIRDIQGVLSRTKPRLVLEIEKCLSETQIKEIEQNTLSLKGILDTLLSHRKPQSGNRNRAKEIDDLERRIHLNIGELERVISRTDVFGSIEEINALERSKIGIEEVLPVYQRDSLERCEKIAALQKKLEIASVNSKHTLVEVVKEIKTLEEESDELNDHLFYRFHFDDPSASLASFQNVKHMLDEISEGLNCLPRLDYSPIEFTMLRDVKIPSEKEKQTKLQKTLTELWEKKLRLEHGKTVDPVNCPKCSHSFYPSYDEVEYNKTCALYGELSLLKEKVDIEVQKLDAVYENSQKFFSLHQSYAALVDRTPLLAPFWTYLSSEEILSKEPSKTTILLQRLYLDLNVHMKLKAISTAIAEKQSLRKMMLDAEKLDTEQIRRAIEEEDGYVLRTHQAIRDAQAKLLEIKTKITLSREIAQLDTSIRELLTERDDSLRILMEDNCISVLDDIIRSVKLEVSQNEFKLSQIQIHEGVVNNLKQTIKDSETELEFCKIIEKTLSPSEGLIARGMSGFINSFVPQLNDFIEHIWTYPLELIPIKPEGDEIDLDYRFKVMINASEDNVSPEVSKTSEGMKEIIDLAFAAVSMKYLGLNDFPIFLDEFAKTFDSAHRQAAYRAIDYLIDSKDYSQVYLVSHYQEGYSGLTDAETLVLCDSNIQLPSNLVYNQHAKFI